MRRSTFHALGATIGSRRTVLKTLVGTGTGLLLGLAAPRDWSSQFIAEAEAAAGPRYFMRFRPIETSSDVDTGSVGIEALKTMAKNNLLEALKKRPEVVMTLDGVPEDAAPERFGDEIKRRKLKGYEVTLKVIKLERKVLPPPTGRKFRMLEQSIKLSLVGTLWPGEPTLALGGDGESTIQIEVGAQISENQERDVLTDVVTDAVGQAVAGAMRKLQIGPMVPPKDPPRRRKK